MGSGPARPDRPRQSNNNNNTLYDCQQHPLALVTFSCTAHVINTYDRDNNKAVDFVNLGFQKAFDKVPHAVRWIWNWLAGRRHRVCINQSYSNWPPVTSGVPHGSALVQLLFILYVNDLETNIVSKTSKFVDDGKLCHRARNSDDIILIHEDSNELFEGANKWQTSFNVDKCYVMHIWLNNMKTNYNISNQQLPATDQQRDLGIIITKVPKWKNKQRKVAKPPTE